jgi:hypothetical protein
MLEKFKFLKEKLFTCSTEAEQSDRCVMLKVLMNLRLVADMPSKDNKLFL